MSPARIVLLRRPGEFAPRMSDPTSLGRGHAAIVLETSLPDIDGFSVCRTIREHWITTQIVFLTACDARRPGPRSQRPRR